MYNELVESCFFAPQHVGRLSSANRTAHYRFGEAGVGDVFEIHLSSDDKGFIQKARFKAYGNPYLIANLEWLCRQLEKSQVHDHPKYNYEHFVLLFAIPDTRLSAALQVEDGYQEVIALLKMSLKGEQNE